MTLDNTIYDGGLSVLTGSTSELYVCSQEPTTVAEANATYKLGTKADITISSPADATGVRQVVVSAITDGTVNATGTVTHWAIVNSAATVLLATGTTTASVVVTSGNEFTLDAINISLQKPPTSV
jgi:hypothetical protein